ncbi:MAG: segregation/condensation protein A, partial [Eubacteriaceae bacterium]|nr:segregation/condensation protein A [Eubacteriaceae bacterium]
EKRLSFFELLSSATGRDEAIALFLAILELYKDNSLQIGQEGAFGDILLEERVS